MINDIVKIALSNLLHRKLRSWLTMIGIFIGITAVVAIISLGQGLQVAINEQFAELGTDKVFISPGESTFSSTDAVVINENDRRIIDRVPGVIETVGASYQSAKIERGDTPVYSLVMGITNDNDLWNDMNKNNILSGRPVKDGDVFKAFVGYDYTLDNKLFDRRLELGDSIIINGHKFEVIGFQDDLGNSQDNQQVQISSDAYYRVFEKRPEDQFMMLIARIDTSENPKMIADRMKKELRNSRGLDEGDEDFTMQTAEEILGSFNSILLIVQVVIVGIASVSLVIGGVGIMNTMYTAVVERTQEIGIMKAIGARNSDVMTIFLIESGLLGFIGGLIGVLLGLGISKSVELGGTLWIGTPYLRAWWSWELILAALSFAFFVGLLSGVLPAYQASRQKPVDSLRYE